MPSDGGAKGTGTEQSDETRIAWRATKYRCECGEHWRRSGLPNPHGI